MARACHLNVDRLCPFLTHHFFPSSVECSFTGNTLTTFNNEKLKNEMPSNCYQVLAQDGTDELKFIVLLRKDRTEHKQISVKIAHM